MKTYSGSVRNSSCCCKVSTTKSIAVLFKDEDGLFFNLVSGLYTQEAVWMFSQYYLFLIDLFLLCVRPSDTVYIFSLAIW